jgi:hypothetical protein
MAKKRELWLPSAFRLRDGSPVTLIGLERLRAPHCVWEALVIALLAGRTVKFSDGSGLVRCITPSLAAQIIHQEISRQEARTVLQYEQSARFVRAATLW